MNVFKCVYPTDSVSISECSTIKPVSGSLLAGSKVRCYRYELANQTSDWVSEIRLSKEVMGTEGEKSRLWTHPLCLFPLLFPCSASVCLSSPVETWRLILLLWILRWEGGCRRPLCCSGSTPSWPWVSLQDFHKSRGNFCKWVLGDNRWTTAHLQKVLVLFLLSILSNEPQSLNRMSTL